MEDDTKSSLTTMVIAYILIGIVALLFGSVLAYYVPNWVDPSHGPAHHLAVVLVVIGMLTFTRR